MGNKVSMSDKGHCLVTWPVGQAGTSLRSVLVLEIPNCNTDRSEAGRPRWRARDVPGQRPWLRWPGPEL